MAIPVEFEWDDKKADVNLRKHGVRFETAIAVFAEPDYVVVDTYRSEDGEHRLNAVGVIQGLTFTTVFVMRGDTCRLVSARRSNAAENRAYGQGKT